MNDLNQKKRDVLYIVTCAARSSEPVYVEDLVGQALSDGWDVGVIATPNARNFIDVQQIEKMTGQAVRCEYRHPDTLDPAPEPDAILVFPATFNTINKWATGIADTLATSVLCAHLGTATPIVAVPCVPDFSLARHPAFIRNVALLQEYGAHVIYDPAKYPPMNNVPWQDLQRALRSATIRARLNQLESEHTSR